MDVEFITGWNINSISANLLAAFSDLINLFIIIIIIDTYLPVIERFVNYSYGYRGIQSINYVRFKINS